MRITQSRLQFLTMLSLASAAGLLRAPPSLAVEQQLETSTVRLANSGLCIAPQYLAEELRTEGFTDIHYVDMSPPQRTGKIARGEVDFTLDYAASLVPAIDRSEPITVLAGVHVGCQELFAREGIRTIADLKGRSVGVQALGSVPHTLVTVMAAHVGLDPGKDIHWVIEPSIKPIELFVDGKIDAFIGFPPEPQHLRDRHIGHEILSTAVDRPWSQYFCCMLAGNREFVRNHPVATKRVLRAILKAADICVTEPARAARRIVDGGFTDRYDYALQTLNELPYDKWREYDAEDTIRFYTLRLRDVGFIKSSPQKIIADGTDWRFLNELKRELKA
jgi:NitT/TauT family transport system substrate-binding protein